MAATPYISTYNVTTVEAPGASLGQSNTDTITFFQGGSQLCTAMVVNQYYTVLAVNGLNFGTYGTLQTNQGTGVANTVGAVYLCTSVPASGTALVAPLPLAQNSSILTNTAFVPLATQTATSGGYGFPSAATFNAFQAQVIALNAALLALGLLND